jgi:hypothetical protein
MFTSSPEHYNRNISESANYQAAAAVLTTPTGDRQPAVVLRNGAYIKAVMPIGDALRLANNIADALDAHNTPQSQARTV